MGCAGALSCRNHVFPVQIFLQKSCTRKIRFITQSMPTNQQPAKMWSGRFREPFNRTFEQWQRSFPFDWRLLPQEVAASKAHAQTIAAAGILTEEELAKTLAGLTAVGRRPENWAHRISATSGAPDYETSHQQIQAAIVASTPQT